MTSTSNYEPSSITTFTLRGNCKIVKSSTFTIRAFTLSLQAKVPETTIEARSTAIWRTVSTFYTSFANYSSRVYTESIQICGYSPWNTFWAGTISPGLIPGISFAAWRTVIEISLFFRIVTLRTRITSGTIYISVLGCAVGSCDSINVIQERCIKTKSNVPGPQTYGFPGIVVLCIGYVHSTSIDLESRHNKSNAEFFIILYYLYLLSIFFSVFPFFHFFQFPSFGVFGVFEVLLKFLRSLGVWVFPKTHLLFEVVKFTWCNPQICLQRHIRHSRHLNRQVIKETIRRRRRYHRRALIKSSSWDNMWFLILRVKLVNI